MKTKSKAYKQVVKDVDFANTQVTMLKDRIQEIGCVAVGSTVTLTSDSSDKQYVYGIGILNSQIATCKELGIEDKIYTEIKTLAVELRSVSKELKEWQDYLKELERYKAEVYKLLSDDEKFKLLEYPKR